MSRGKRPERRWDGTPWEGSSEVGKLASDHPDLPYRAALIYIKGDWSEHAHSLGLASWSSTWAPCQFCTLAKFELHSLYHHMRDGMPWQLRTTHSYDEACGRCEVNVALRTPADRNAFLRVLRWKKASKQIAIGGRIVVTDAIIGGKQLLAGDRLEPSLELTDVHSLERSSLPVNVVLWRTHRDHKHRSMDSVSHRCPLFAQCIGTSPHGNLAVDELHCVYFGPIMRYVSTCMWRVVLANYWDFTGTIEQVIEQGTRQLSAELLSWQDNEHVPPNQRLSGITPKMLGARKGYNTQDARG
eukprot:8144937-Pyramimonas_sp.AAC.1